MTTVKLQDIKSTHRDSWRSTSPSRMYKHSCTGAGLGEGGEEGSEGQEGIAVGAGFWEGAEW